MNSGQRRFLTGVAALTVAAGSSLARGGSVTLDGSFGRAAGTITPVNGVYSLNQTNGKQVGKNLFFGLGQLNLDQGDKARFFGPADVSRVIVRVSGGASMIDGTIRSDANFYLINSNGVVFGPGAKLATKGRFVVSTASVVTLADGTELAAPGASDAALTTAPPAEFGFLKSSQVKINGAQLNLKNQAQSLSILAGNVKIKQGALLAGEDANLQVVAMGNSGAVRLGAATGGIAVPETAAAGGQIVVDGTSRLIADGNGIGQINLIAGQLSLDGTISDVTFGEGSAAQINIDGAANCTIDGGSLTTGTTTNSPGGRITIHCGGDLMLLGGAKVTAQSETHAHSAGLSGDIGIDATNLTVQDGSEISAATFSPARAGSIELNVENLRLNTSGEILTETGGAGAGGAITVHSGSISISGAGEDSDVATGLFADTKTGSAGAGGEISLTTGSLSIWSLGTISTTTNGLGAGGKIMVAAAGAIQLDGGNLTGFTGIGANSQFAGAGAGNGGGIRVSASTIDIIDGAGISANTRGPGKGGSIHLQGSLVAADGNNLPRSNLTGVFAESQSSGPGGDGGNIVVHAGQLELFNGARIATKAVGPGSAGGATSGGTTNRNAGNVVLQSSQLLLAYNNSVVTTKASGNGGNITIDPDLVVLRNSKLSAMAIDRRGGNIEIAADQLLESNSIIDASSEFGISGTVVVSSPATNIAGALIALRTALVVHAVALQPVCGQMVGDNVSSFIPVGNGGTAAEPGGILPSFDPFAEEPNP